MCQQKKASVFRYPFTMDAFSPSNQPSPPSPLNPPPANTNGSNMQAAKISGIPPVPSSIPRWQQNAYFWPCPQPLFTPYRHDNQALSICPQGIKSMLILSMLLPGVFRGACGVPSLRPRPITTRAVMDVLLHQPFWTSSHQNTTINHSQASQTLLAIININRNKIRGKTVAKNWPSLSLEANYPPRGSQQARLLLWWSDLAKNATTNQLERPQMHCCPYLNQFNESGWLLGSGRLQITTIQYPSPMSTISKTTLLKMMRKNMYCPKQ